MIKGIHVDEDIVVDERVIPIWNTMAVIPGHIKNESVLLGCHRDGQLTLSSREHQLSCFIGL